VLAVRIEGKYILGSLLQSELDTCLQGRSLPQIDDVGRNDRATRERRRAGLVLRAIVHHDNVGTKTTQLLDNTAHHFGFMVSVYHDPAAPEHFLHHAVSISPAILLLDAGATEWPSGGRH
jgi:hypothetical protein